MEASLPAEIKEDPGIYAIAFDIPGLKWNRPLIAPCGNPVAYIGVATDVRERCEHHFFGPAKPSGFRITAWSLLRRLEAAPELKGKAAEHWLTEFLKRSATLVWAECIYPLGIEARLLRKFEIPCNLQGQKGSIRQLAAASRRALGQELTQ